MNKAIVMGHLTKDPVLKQTASWVSVCSISIATNEKYKNRDGEMVEKSTFHDVVLWRQPADFAAKYAHKWDLVLVEGKIEKRTWDKDDGTKWYATEIVAENFNICKSASPRKDNLTTDDVEGVFGDDDGGDIPF